jgi:hypothetical protein
MVNETGLSRLPSTQLPLTLQSLHYLNQRFVRGRALSRPTYSISQMSCSYSSWPIFAATATLFSLCLSSKRLNAIVTKPLYTHIKLTSLNVPRLLRTLLDRADFAGHVEALHLGTTGITHLRNHPDRATFEPLKERAVQATQDLAGGIQPQRMLEDERDGPALKRERKSLRQENRIARSALEHEDGTSNNPLEGDGVEYMYTSSLSMPGYKYGWHFDIGRQRRSPCRSHHRSAARPEAHSALHHHVNR